ncbi:hypothetical protein [Nonomuraea sp. NPDC050786]|uniref:hypothetical protein n=1 Tax=Nonomuraea sp. NPDC050786 TaxID=3154840 RepID=UPI0033CB111C
MNTPYPLESLMPRGTGVVSTRKDVEINPAAVLEMPAHTRPKPLVRTDDRVRDRQADLACSSKKPSVTAHPAPRSPPAREKSRSTAQQAVGRGETFTSIPPPFTA